MRDGTGRMFGLLEKARKLRSSLGLSVDGRDELAFDPDSGISREDQKDILKEIEKVATENRIAVSPGVFAVKAAKRGVLFPILVNLIAVVALVVGLALFYYFFQLGETRLARSETGTITAEGKLIEELKKESEARLLEKNQQINQIQERLTEIDKQRQDLQANMDAKVRDREAQLKASLAAELDAERARLRGQGLSDQDIAKRIADLETRKNAEYARQLDAFRAQAEQDRQKADANLKSLQDEFNASLARANQERQQVIEDSKKREADLQAQLEQRTREVESARAQSDQALQALQSQRQQEDLVSGQLVGLYSVVKADITAKDYPKAVQSLQAIRDFVNRADVAALPAIQQRRDVDMFVADSLESYVQGQLSATSVDTSSLVAAAGLISDVRSAVTQADAQVRAGNITEAEKLYAQALATIPEISRSYAYFTDKAKNAQDAREQVLANGLTRAEAAYEAGQFPEMLAAYREALVYLPESSARLDKMLANIAGAGSEQGRQRGQAEQTRAAAPIAAQGDAALAQGRAADAIARYLTILERYPQSSQAAAAVAGVSKAVTALGAQADAKLASRQKELEGRISTLEKQVADRGNDLSSQVTRTEAASAALQKRIDALSAENEKLKATTDKGAADAGARLAALSQGYSSYTSREDPILQARGDKGLVDTKAYLDDFLGSRPVQETFPGISERIKRYDQGFLAAGRTNAIQDMLDVVIELTRQKSPDGRAKFLSQQLDAHKDDPDMSELVKGLQGLLK